MSAIVFWLVLSVLVGAIGSNRKIGFATALFVALFLSPLVGFIVVLFSKSKASIEQERRLDAMQREQTDALRRLSGQPVIATGPYMVNDIVLPADYNARVARLKDLRDRGIITQEEFMEQIGRL